jgi:ribosomal protein S18 acetylase RimI-like enzyme
MELMPIDAARKDFLLRAQYRSMTTTYRRTYPTARWELIELAGAPIGRLITHVGDSFVTYVDIALAPQAQGRGLATRLMTQALEEPRRLGLPARVNVLATNGASLKLCERVGFVRVGESPPFVELEWRP